MTKSQHQKPLIAIACGGTGGHLYPGIAIAEELLRLDCDVMLLVSPKDVDQHAVKTLQDVEVQTIPAVGLTRGNLLGFSKGFLKSYRATRQQFAMRPPQAVLSMGGFTSAAPAMAGRSFGAKVFLHESNTIPGKANRWLAHFADQAFVFFHDTSSRLSMQKIDTVGMPVRAQFLEPADPQSARMALGLDPKRPVLLIMGGSQGATGVNNLVINSLPFLLKRTPELQFLHLTGANDADRVRRAYSDAKAKAVVHPFLTEMDLALGAATIAISRSGASSLAEIAATGVPSILIPYPHAAENHQYYNALAFVETGAALMFEQSAVSPERLSSEIVGLLKCEKARNDMRSALRHWHVPNAAEVVAERIVSGLPHNRHATSFVRGQKDFNEGDLLKKEANA